MTTLFPDEAFKNANLEEPWKKSQTDKMLEMYLAGAHPDRIAQELGRTPKAVKRRLEQFTYNERERCERYEPIRRTSRIQKKLTQNELLLIKEHRERKVPLELTLKILQRRKEDLIPQRAVDNLVLATIAPTQLEMLLACRYVFEVYNHRVVSDEMYDEMKEEQIKFGGGLKELDQPCAKYPEEIKDLALFYYHKVKLKHGTVPERDRKAERGEA